MDAKPTFLMEELVREFHWHKRQYELSPRNMTAVIPDHVKILRMRLIAEEMGELFQAMHEENLVEIADALADLAYVVYGTAIAYGIPLTDVLMEVHRSNMTKDGLNSHGKQGKGEGFEPPRIQQILESAKDATYPRTPWRHSGTSPI